MALNEWNDRRLDDLAAQVRVMAALATQVATNSANITAHDDDLKRTARMLERLGEECEAHTQRVERKLDQQVKQIVEAQNAKRWTPSAIATLFAPIGASIVTVLAVLLK